MDIVQLEYWNKWAGHYVHGQCPLSPWKLSIESMGNVQRLSGHCPWTQWTFSMDSVDIVQSVAGLFPHTLYRAMRSEGVLMFSLQCMSFLFHDLQCM